jgi:hypothetical protein
MKTRGTVKLSFEGYTHNQGFNLGDLKGVSLRSHALFDEGIRRVIPTAMFRIWGPKTSFALTKKDVAKDGFTAEGLWLKPMHGFPFSTPDAKGVVVETNLEPMHIEFDASGDRPILKVKTAKRSMERPVDVSPNKRDNALLREVCRHILPTIVASIRSPRACIVVTEKEVDKLGFKLTAYVAYPLGDAQVEGMVFETDNVPVSIRFDLPTEEAPAEEAAPPA